MRPTYVKPSDLRVGDEYDAGKTGQARIVEVEPYKTAAGQTRYSVVAEAGPHRWRFVATRSLEILNRKVAE